MLVACQQVHAAQTPFIQLIDSFGDLRKSLVNLQISFNKVGCSADNKEWARWPCFQSNTCPDEKNALTQKNTDYDSPGRWSYSAKLYPRSTHIPMLGVYNDNMHLRSIPLLIEAGAQRLTKLNPPKELIDALKPYKEKANIFFFIQVIGYDNNKNPPLLHFHSFLRTACSKFNSSPPLIHLTGMPAGIFNIEGGASVMGENGSIGNNRLNKIDVHLHDRRLSPNRKDIAINNSNFALFWSMAILPPYDELVKQLTNPDYLKDAELNNSRSIADISIVYNLMINSEKHGAFENIVKSHMTLKDLYEQIRTYAINCSDDTSQKILNDFAATLESIGP